MRQHVFALAVAMAVWIVANLVGIFKPPAEAMGTTGAETGYCYQYERLVRIESHCSPSGQRCSGYCSKIVAREGGCRQTSQMICCREFYTKDVPYIYQSQCVGSPPCTSANCGVIWNPWGWGSELIDIRQCEHTVNCI
jgi:hypothetical protein